MGFYKSAAVNCAENKIRLFRKIFEKLSTFSIPEEERGGR